MLGRSKLATKCRASPSPSRCVISPWVAGVAVAVSAIRGTSGQHRQLQVLGPEVVAPLRDAVRLVDREERDAPAFQQGGRGRHPQPLRRQVEQVQLAGQVHLLDRAALVGILGRVEEPGADAQRAQRVDLVLHEGDQRRDDDPDTGPHERRDLVAQRLAAAGRHEHQRVAARADVLHDRLLLAAEGVVAEDPPQDVQRGGGRVGEHAPRIGGAAAPTVAG
jgi:hypothetical protein